MTAPLLPTEWASNAVYTAGSAIGLETKTDPGAALTAEGLTPGRNGAQHLNHLLNDLTVRARRAARVCALQFRRQSVMGVTLPSSGGLGVVSQNNAALPIVGAKGGTSGSFLAYANTPHMVTGSTTSTLTSCTAIARSGAGRIVILGATSPFSAYSTNEGASWTGGGNQIGSAGNCVLWNPIHSRFMATKISSPNVYYSADVTAWTAVDSGLTAASDYSGLGMWSDGDVLFLGGGDLTIGRVSTNGAVSWSNLALTWPNAATMVAIDAGHLASAGTDTIYHVGRLSTTEMQVSAITNGSATVAVLATITLPTSTFNARPRIYQCQDTGLLVIAVTTGDSHGFVYASLDGVTWEGPAMVGPIATPFDVGVAGGRIWVNNTTEIAATDGIL